MHAHDKCTIPQDDIQEERRRSWCQQGAGRFGYTVAWSILGSRLSNSLTHHFRLVPEHYTYEPLDGHTNLFFFGAGNGTTVAEETCSADSEHLAILPSLQPFRYGTFLHGWYRLSSRLSESYRKAFPCVAYLSNGRNICCPCSILSLYDKLQETHVRQGLLWWIRLTSFSTNGWYIPGISLCPQLHFPTRRQYTFLLFSLHSAQPKCSRPWSPHSPSSK
ncbi:hypothetical protein B0H19DRAFT_625521 [Mycena capillaripes]|nr:hypothetical protein B0H19DRAFT_625521 [Mycena capillaripes]